MVGSQCILEASGSIFLREETKNDVHVCGTPPMLGVYNITFINNRCLIQVLETIDTENGTKLEYSIDASNWTAINLGKQLYKLIYYVTTHTQ